MKTTLISTFIAALLVFAPQAGFAQAPGTNAGDRKAPDQPAKESDATANPDRPKNGQAGAPRQRTTLPELFAQLDKDGDGKLTKEEFMKLPRRTPGMRTGQPGKDAAARKDDAAPSADTKKKTETDANQDKDKDKKE